jgi:hypothetical protein
VFSAFFAELGVFARNEAVVFQYQVRAKTPRTAKNAKERLQETIRLVIISAVVLEKSRVDKAI